jgi:hypothetical protein
MMSTIPRCPNQTPIARCRNFSGAQVIQTVVIEAGNGKDLKGNPIPSKSGYINFCDYLKNGFCAVGWLSDFDLSGKSSAEIDAIVDQHVSLDLSVSTAVTEEEKKKLIKSNRIAAKRVLNRLMTVRPGDIVIVPGATHRIYGVGVATSAYRYQKGKMDPNGLGNDYRSHFIDVAWVEWSSNHKADFAKGSGHYLEREAFVALGAGTLWPGLGFTISVNPTVPDYLTKSSFWGKLEGISSQVQANQPISVAPVLDEPEEVVEDLVQEAPVEKEYTGDPFTISEDGHYVGNDGFIVPKNFSEFYEFHRAYVRRWAMKHLFKPSVDDDVMDLEADLLMHLHSLPERSKARTPGYNGLPEGCKDVIESFNPRLQYGASAPRFFNYIKRCLYNRCNTIYAKTSKNPICSPGNYSVGTMSEDAPGVVDDEYIHSHSASMGATNQSQISSLDTKMLILEFCDFVRKEEPYLIEVMTAIANTHTYGEATEELGIDDKAFQRHRSRLKVLAQCFESASAIPKQRKEYRKRSLTLVSA